MCVLVFVCLFAPYKYYTSIFIGVTTPNCSTTIAEQLLSGGIDVFFIFLFLPILVLAEVFYLKDISSKWRKFIFVIQGIGGVFGTYMMFWIMTFYLLEANIRLTPIFYLSLAIVIVSSLASLLLVVPKINSQIKKHITSAPSGNPAPQSS